MHFYVAGGTGQNGRLIIKEALGRGHTVTALARDPSSLEPHPNLTVVQGTPTSSQDVKKALRTPRAPDAALSALAITRTSGSPFSPISPGTPPDLLSSAASVLLEALDEARLSPAVKVVYNSSVGTPPSAPSLNFLMRLVFAHARSMRLALEDHARAEARLRDSGRNYVAAKAVALVGEGRKRVNVLGEDGKGAGFFPTISRESLAAFMIDAAEKGTWDRTSPVVTN
ncbi:hypothetical protein N3K66_008592 [Trichothecium roseum]|uniref:Uncharacterized protein n=1 Tax=Trichothecium roseum TaxID=47278 RepID=A0ACC0UQM8_9HYPO|nr:hypothetical protein N3K66_008592 [Trichothecium roseum]